MSQAIRVLERVFGPHLRIIELDGWHLLAGANTLMLSTASFSFLAHDFAP
ncbi:hypothetical protein [Rhizobium binae]|nr:hypothetical protein [Rhizobium binae]MBX4927422.1 hypothetical protein [Rhizobium binae]